MPKREPVTLYSPETFALKHSASFTVYPEKEGTEKVRSPPPQECWTQPVQFTPLSSIWALEDGNPPST